jgi:hypothetical protein
MRLKRCVRLRPAKYGFNSTCAGRTEGEGRGRKMKEGEGRNMKEGEGRKWGEGRK